MSLLAGTVSVAPDGTVTGSGYAMAVYDQLELGTAFLGTPLAGEVAAKKQLAAVCNAAGALMDYIVTNAVVTTTDTGTAPIAWTGVGSGVVT